MLLLSKRIILESIYDIKNIKMRN